MAGRLGGDEARARKQADQGWPGMAAPIQHHREGGTRAGRQVTRGLPQLSLQMAERQQDRSAQRQEDFLAGA